MGDFAIQRKNMVESQVRPSDVTDRRIIRAMLEIPREAFVPKALRPIAYMDEAIPLAGEGGHTSPRVISRALMAARPLARLIQLLELGERDLVLEVGTGTGYAAAVLSRIAQTVVALEQDPELAARAQTALAGLGFDTVAVVTGALEQGYPDEGPYDAILISGAVEEVPAQLLDQLKDGGRLVAVMIDGPLGRATQWRRLGSTFDRRAAFEAGVPALPGFKRKREFVF